MKGKDLKILVNQIADDAEVVIDELPDKQYILAVLDNENTITDTYHIMHSHAIECEFCEHEIILAKTANGMSFFKEDEL